MNELENRVKVTGIAYQAHIAKITVRSLPDQPGIAAALFEPLAAKGISVDTIVQNTSLERVTDISFTLTRSDLPQAIAEVQAVLSQLGGTEVVRRPHPRLGSRSWVGGCRTPPATPPGCSASWPTATSTST